MKHKQKEDKKIPAGGLLAVILVLTGIAFYFFNPEKEVVPTFSELYGAWYSEEPRYQDCYLDIDETLIAIGAADGKEYLYFIESFEKVTTNHTTSYTFNTKNLDGDDFTFWLNLAQKGNLSMMNFKNQPHISWTKERMSSP